MLIIPVFACLVAICSCIAQSYELASYVDAQSNLSIDAPIWVRPGPYDYQTFACGVENFLVGVSLLCSGNASFGLELFATTTKSPESLVGTLNSSCNSTGIGGSSVILVPDSPIWLHKGRNYSMFVSLPQTGHTLVALAQSHYQSGYFFNSSSGSSNSDLVFATHMKFEQPPRLNSSLTFWLMSNQSFETFPIANLSGALWSATPIASANVTLLNPSFFADSKISMTYNITSSIIVFSMKDPPQFPSNVTLKFMLKVQDSSVQCVIQGKAPIFGHGCVTEFVGEIFFDEIENCPPIAIGVYDPAIFGGFATWDSPQLSSRSSNLSSSANKFDVFPLGITIVQYFPSNQISVQTRQSILSCSFRVDVSILSAAKMTSHLFFNGTSFDSLYEAAGIFDPSNTNNVDLTFVGDVLAKGISLSFSALSRTITFTAPKDYQANANIDLVWCQNGHSFEGKPVIEATCEGYFEQVSVQLGSISQELPIYPIPIARQRSLVSVDGTCARLSFVSEYWDGGEEFKYFAFHAMHFILLPVYPTTKPALSAFVSQETSYAIIQWQPIFENATLFVDYGSTVQINDGISPEYQGCPSNIVVTAASGMAYANATWPEPTATDNVGVELERKSHLPNSTFLVAHSPVTVTYEAVDAAGNIGACKFNIVIKFHPVPLNISKNLTQTLISTSLLKPNFHTLGCSSKLLDGTKVGSNFDIIISTASNYSQILISISNFQNRYQTRLQANRLIVKLEVDLIWFAEPQLLQTTDVQSVFTGFDFKDASYSSQWNEDNAVGFGDWFKSGVESTVAPNHFLHMKGSGVLDQAFSFSSFQVSLNFPQTVLLNGTYRLSPGSFIRISQYFLDISLDPLQFPPLRFVDDQPPAVTNCPKDQILFASSFPNVSQVAVTWANPNATDNRQVKSFTSDAPMLFDVPSDTTVTYTAIDENDNINQACSFTIHVVDDVSPSISCPPAASQVYLPDHADKIQVQLEILEPDASTFSDNSVTPSYTISPVGFEYGVGVYDIVRVISDSSLNNVSCAIHLEVLDRTSPVLVCPANIVVAGSSNGAIANWSNPNATDNSGAVAVVLSMNSSSLFPPGVTSVLVSAKDPSGNEAQCSFLVTVLSTAAVSTASSNTSQIAGGVIGGFLGLVALVLVVFLMRRRKQESKPQNFDEIIASLANMPMRERTRIPREIRRDTVKLLDVLGKGNFGEVRKGLLSEISGIPGYLIAVKTLHNTFGTDRTAILAEAAIMAQFHNDFVVGLVGVVTIGEPLLVILEYCEHGSLDRYLKKHEIPNHMKLAIAGDCAEGLAYLAENKFIHRDIAARNILLSSERHAKIADFGMSREIIDSNYYFSKSGQVPVRWTAPEALDERKFSHKSDCWSFGVLLYEIWTRGSTPYDGMNNQKVWVSVTTGYRLPNPGGECPGEAYSLMLECWHSDPDQRPDFNDALRVLRRLMSREDQQDRPHLDSDAKGRHTLAEYVEFISQSALEGQSVEEKNRYRTIETSGAVHDDDGVVYDEAAANLPGFAEPDAVV